MSRRTIASLALAFGAAGAILAQSTSPAFDVASVKRFQPPATGRPSDAIRLMPGGRLTAPSVTLRALITTAYAILDIEVDDAGRINADARYEIDARTRADVTADEARAMLRTLLAERFGLVTHRETRDLPVYAMSVVRDQPGKRLRRSGQECAPVQAPAGIPAPPPLPLPPPPAGQALLPSRVPPRCPAVFFSSTVGTHWSLREVTMGRFTERLIAALNRPVLDRTGLEGAFDIDLTFTADNPSVDSSDAPNAPALMTAIREQLGLRLESTRASVDVLVVDRVQPPSDN
ncbi:MAG TPA: TIGR03435 family protein [Vicinamibacterales bacterium]|nr:TIGR03435 family protein [Vicinamibacterales bacterium]